MNPTSSWKRFVVLLLIAPPLVLFIVFLGITLHTLVFPRNLCSLATRNPTSTAFIERYRKEYQQRTGKGLKISIVFTPLSQISPFLREAVILAEDPRFYEHSGIDFKELWESLKTNLDRKAFVRGGSTIPQQLVKNLYLSPEKSLIRKWREIILALRISRCLTKERILELYLNVAEWGPGIFGINAAAQRYFHKAPSGLTAEESALLASILPNPRRYKIASPSPRIRKKAEKIEKLLISK